MYFLIILDYENGQEHCKEYIRCLLMKTKHRVNQSKATNKLHLLTTN